MRALLILSLLIAHVWSSGQESPTYLLRWDLKDTAEYKIVLAPVNVDLEVERNAFGNSDLKQFTDHLKNKIAEAFKEYPLTSTIHRGNENFKVKFLYNGNEILKGDVSDRGELLTQVEEGSKNFFKFFFNLPVESIQVGDKWQSNIRYPLNLRNINIQDSTRKDEVIFEKIVESDSGRFAVIKTYLKEDLTTAFENEDGTSGNGKIVIVYNATGFFDFDRGRWNRIDGVSIFDFDLGVMKDKKVVKIGLLEIDRPVPDNR